MRRELSFAGENKEYAYKTQTIITIYRSKRINSTLGPCLTDLSVDQCPSWPPTSIVFFLFWSTIRVNAEPHVCLPLCPQLHRGPRVQGTQCCEATRD